MSQIEYLREKLYELIETGDSGGILMVSQELDKLILSYIENQINLSRKSA